MKVKWLSIVVSALVVLACNKQDDLVPILKVQSSAMDAAGDINVAGGKTKISFQIYSNQNWQSESDVEWIDIHTKVGKPSNRYQNVEVTVLFNESDKERIGKIIFRTTSQEKTITIRQGLPDNSTIWGNGTESSPYVIKTAEQLNTIRKYLKSGSTTYICLGNDIDLSSVPNFVPLNDTSPYNKEIHFDGKGFTISNLTSIYVISDLLNPSFFGVLKGSCSNLTIKDATIKDDPETGRLTPAGIISAYASTPVILNNVHVSGVVKTNSPCAGGLVGSVCGATIENCTADVNISSGGRDNAGGLVGQVKSGKFIVRNSRVSGSVYGYGNVGGLIGGSLKEASLDIQDCHSTANVRGHDYIGGFAGYLDNDESRPAKITNTSASGDVYLMSDRRDMSAFVGMVKGGCEFIDCYALGKASSALSCNNFGGIIARTITETGKIHLKNCHCKKGSTGSVTTGGIVGWSIGDIIIEDCSAEGDFFSQTSYSGGIIGLVEEGMATITRSCFKGTLQGKDGVGGVIGYLSRGTAIISECWTDGHIASCSDGLGGIVGRSEISVTIKNCCSSCDMLAYDYSGMYDVKCAAAGGILGLGNKAVVIENCYASGDIEAVGGVGGIVGVFDSVKNAEVRNSLAWNKFLVATREQVGSRSSGAIIGLVRSGAAILIDNYRRADLQIVDSFLTGLCDHENVSESLPPLPSGITDYNQRAYHGRKADHGATLAALAKSLGWDAAIWNFNSDGSDLGFPIKPLGDNKIEF